MRVRCCTFFDCTATGTTGRYLASQTPYLDRAGQRIQDQADWNRSRNQQRNWETLLQIIGLRCQPMDVSSPVHHDRVWEFEFSVETEGVFDQDFRALYRDCVGVPMVINAPGTDIAMLSIEGPEQNIWFDLVNNSNGSH
jgi:hypothetical protein